MYSGCIVLYRHFLLAHTTSCGGFSRVRYGKVLVHLTKFSRSEVGKAVSKEGLTKVICECQELAVAV